MDAILALLPLAVVAALFAAHRLTTPKRARRRR